MNRRLAVVVALVAVLVGALAGPASASPRVTVLGDSVQDALRYQGGAAAALRPGLDLRLESRGCQRLVITSCSAGGRTPETTLQAIRRIGPGLGPVVVVHVGYNDGASDYHMDSVLSALRAAGVQRVVWLTLREGHRHYRHTNALIRRVAEGDPLVAVADWNAHSAGRPWFVSDGVHLNATGTHALAAFLRERIVEAFASIGVAVPGETPVGELTAPDLTVAAAGAAGDTLWVVSGRRLVPLDATSGRPDGRSVTLGRGEHLVADGQEAWVHARGGGLRRVRPDGPPVDAPVLGDARGEVHTARVAGARWLAHSCARTAESCRGAWTLHAAGGRSAQALPWRVDDLRGGGGRLCLVHPAGRGSVLEWRDPRTGRLRGERALPGRVEEGGLALCGRRTWVMTTAGALVTAARTGPTRQVAEGVRAAAAGDGVVWALKRDGVTVLRIDPATGAITGVALTPRPAGAGARLVAAGGGVWVLDPGRRGLVHVVSGALS